MKAAARLDRVRLARAVQVLLWAGLIFALSSISNPPDSTSSEGFSRFAHLVEYAVLAFLLVRCGRVFFPHASNTALIAGAWAVAVLYGVSDEIHQSFVPNRHADPWDVVVDAGGAALGLLVWWVLRALAGMRARRAVSG